MNFGEKVKELRTRKGWNQSELARQLGVTPRTVACYENGVSYPRRMEMYERLAKVLETEVNYLRTEDEEFTEETIEKYGSRGRRQAEAIKAQTAALFAGGELSEADEMAFMKEMYDIFYDVKLRAKRFTNKRYQKDKE